MVQPQVSYRAALLVSALVLFNMTAPAGAEGFRKEKLSVLVPALAIPLGFTGLSIGMREGVYRNDPSANWMVPVNSFLTLGPGVAAVSALAAGGLVYAIRRGDSDGIPAALWAGAAGGIAGFIAGTIVFMFPAARETFVTYPGLYYLPSVLGCAAGGLIFLKVLLE